eukprot:scaffold94507_cov17-Tisochrysis_lutea.AAC.1
MDTMLIHTICTDLIQYLIVLTDKLKAWLFSFKDAGSFVTVVAISPLESMLKTVDSHYDELFTETSSAH